MLSYRCRRRQLPRLFSTKTLSAVFVCPAQVTCPFHRSPLSFVLVVLMHDPYKSLTYSCNIQHCQLTASNLYPKHCPEHFVLNTCHLSPETSKPEAVFEIVYTLIPAIPIMSVDIDKYPSLQGCNMKRFNQLQTAALSAVLITVKRRKVSLLTPDD